MCAYQTSVAHSSTEASGSMLLEIDRTVLWVMDTPRGCTVVSWLALSPHSERATGSVPGLGGPSVWSLHVLPVAFPASSHRPKTCSQIIDL